MDEHREKQISDNWDDIVFSDEAIESHFIAKQANLPPALAEARAMERSPGWRPRQAIFLDQARFLADYEDDFVFSGDPVRYYPTYQSLNDEELRGYFSWRAKVRRGEFPAISPSFIFLYIYELLNQIGVSDPADGYEKLIVINRQYGATENKIPAYLEQWLIDYVVYYNLDRALLEDTVQVVQDGCVGVLERISEEKKETVLDAIKQLAPVWLSRSKFYASHYEDMDTVIYRVFRRMADHYASKCKKSMTEQFFGILAPQHTHIFSTAVFCDPLERRSYEYSVDEQFHYKCENGIWSVSRRMVTQRAIRKLDKALKTIDAIMRDEFSFGHAIKIEVGHKWLIDIIRDETRNYLAEKTASRKQKPAIDLSRLDKIRQDAAATQVKLVVEEEIDFPPEAQIQTPETPDNNAGELLPVESRFLRCMLHGEDLGWIKDEGYLLSVLVDQINEKLFDIFGDSVVDDTPQLVEDYIDDLKELIKA